MSDRELRKKITELKAIAAKEKLDIRSELARLRRKVSRHSGRSEPDAWNRVETARDPSRPTALDYIGMITDQFLELHGDRNYADDRALIGGIGLIDDYAVTIIGNQRGKNMKENLRRNHGMAHPEGYRKALRLAKQAEKFNRPILSLIDTMGAYPGIAAEERGIGEAIARNLRDFSMLTVPILIYVCGEGGSGGALGIGVGDQTIMFENAVYSVITPEGCASILLRDAGQAKYAASLLKMTAADLLNFGVIDEILPEPPGGAQTNPQLAAETLRKHIVKSLKYYSRLKPEQLLKERSKKIFSLGIHYEPPPPGLRLFRGGPKR
jgi:acetyl-CoA carboxylase carboxyl transferase subunit alpha